MLASDAQHVPVMNAKESAFEKLLNSSEGIATTLTDVLDHVNKILSEENTQRLSKTLANLQSFTDTLAAQKEDLASLIKSARDASDHLDHTLADAEKTMGSINSQFGAKLPGMSEHLDHTLAQLDSFTKDADAMLATNRGSIDNFSSQGLAQLGPTLTQLRQVLRQLNALTSQLEENPAGYLLGRNKPQEFEPK